VTLCLVVRVVGQSAQRGAISVGSFVAFWTAAWRLRAAMTRLSDSLSAVFDAHFAIVQIREFLSLPPRQASGGHVGPDIVGRIELLNASYRYPGAEHAAVDQVSLTIEPGEVIALVGPNGAGKTTLARLITRLYEASSGTVAIDGHDVREWDIDALHRQMSVVFQEPVRFEATAMESVAFGDWERLLDQPERVREIARQTGLDPILSALPRGYHTHLGRNFGDCDLSGGQWRRLAVTQALARDPRVIVLDEPYANLDPVAEEELYQSIARLLKGRTAILISHRFSTLCLADRIIAMDAGRIVEQGTHDELLRLDGLYASLYRTSLARFDLSAAHRKCA
jgi:ATP-binding cassette subfamily B protein